MRARAHKSIKLLGLRVANSLMSASYHIFGARARALALAFNSVQFAYNGMRCEANADGASVHLMVSGHEHNKLKRSRKTKEKEVVV